MISRRSFLLTAAAGCVAGLSAPAFAARLSAADRQLRLYNLHTGERLTSTYWAQGQYLDHELAAVNYFLRDYRNDEIERIDPRLLDQICLMHHMLDRKGTFHVISGYRSPQTNAWLRRHETGVAKHSLHMQGRAIDLRLPGVELSYLRRVALTMHAGGVGYYPKSDFIHLDTGRPRYW